MTFEEMRLMAEKIKEIEEATIQSALNFGPSEEIFMPEECLVTCMKVEENHTDNLPIGFICTLIDGLIPPGFKPLEDVEFFIVSNDDPPEVGFMEMMADIFK